MTDRRRYWLVAFSAVLALALGLRLLPLAWSPYPATLDGFGYAAHARDTLAVGQFPFDRMRADNPVFTGLLATAGSVLGLTPLRVAQPVAGVVGATSLVALLAVGRRFGQDLGFSPEKVRLAVVVLGLGLAIDGLYLRRTSVPDEEILAFVFIPVLVLALHRGLRSGRRAWLLPAAVILLAFPLTHTFSTFVAATTLVAWLVAARHRLTLRKLLVGTTVVGAFWVYFAAYYTVTADLGMNVPYVDRITAHPGLFVAWLVAMVVGIWWYQGTGRRARTTVLALPFLVGFMAVFANAVRPVFPGTAESPLLLAAVVGLYLVPVALTVGAADLLGSRSEAGVVLLALLAAPITITGFSLTADLTPEFFGTVMRVQTFAHPPVIALAALVVAGGVTLRRLDRWGRPLLVAVLLASLLLTTPVAYVDLDTLAFPSTTTESEFQAASFVATSVPGQFASDHVLTRITSHYYNHGGSMGASAAWLEGGLPPPCPMLSAGSWTTSGAHFFPAGPQTIGPAAYESALAKRHLVYDSGPGYDQFDVSLPLNATAGC